MTIFVLTKKSGPFLDPFWSKIWPFLLKNQVFGHFLRIHTSDLSKTWSETWDNCFEASNGRVVSRKILVMFLFNWATAERPQHCALVGIENYLVVFFWKIDVYGSGKIQPRPFWAFFIQICPFLAQNPHFGLYLPKVWLNFAYFWYRNLSYGLL